MFISELSDEVMRHTLMLPLKIEQEMSVPLSNMVHAFERITESMEGSKIILDRLAALEQRISYKLHGTEVEVPLSVPKNDPLYMLEMALVELNDEKQTYKEARPILRSAGRLVEDLHDARGIPTDDKSFCLSNHTKDRRQAIDGKFADIAKTITRFPTTCYLRIIAPYLSRYFVLEGPIAERVMNVWPTYFNDESPNVIANNMFQILRGVTLVAHGSQELFPDFSPNTDARIYRAGQILCAMHDAEATIDARILPLIEQYNFGLRREYCVELARWMPWFRRDVVEKGPDTHEKGLFHNNT